MTSLSWQHTLGATDVDDILDLLAAAERTDGTGPVSEDVRLTLRPGLRVGDGRHLLARPGAGLDAGLDAGSDAGAGVADRHLAGYAYLGGEGRFRQAEVVVHPKHRGHGVGRALVDGLTSALSGPAELDVWAHGDLPAAAALAVRAGFAPTRVLLQLRRPLAGATLDGGPAAPPLAEAALPAGVTVRAFVPGRDEPAWLTVNAAAFADHPEQGRWTADDLARREAEPWFDPRGFFLAERDGDLVGFHWTKVHPVDETPPPGAEPAPIGEVYVVGVRPGADGAGLGRALTLIGLRHLADEGLGSVLLYVDEDNIPAVRMYTRLGFTTHTRDVSYHWQGPAAG